MRKLIKGIHHIALKCQGAEAFEKTVEFYRDVLGLEVARTWGEGETSGIMFETGSGLLEIFANAPDTLPQGTIRHFALATDDVDACIETVRKAGYQVTTEPKDICIVIFTFHLVNSLMHIWVKNFPNWINNFNTYIC